MIGKKINSFTRYKFIIFCNLAVIVYQKYTALYISGCGD